MRSADQRNECVLCLGAAHLDSPCGICSSFGHWGLTERINKLILKGVLASTVSAEKVKSTEKPSAPPVSANLKGDKS